MASPFDFYQGKQFEGLDPNRFNKEAYAEQQRQLFANTFKDQLGKLAESYQQQTGLTSENKKQAELTSKKLEELNSKTGDYLKKLKDVESSVTSTKNLINSYTNQKNENDRRRNSAQSNLSRSQANYNNARNQQARYQKSYVNIQNKINSVQRTLSRYRPGTSAYNNLKKKIAQLQNHKDYRAWTSLQNQMNSYASQNNKYSREISYYNNISNTWANRIKEQNNVLNQRNKNLQQVNNETNAHKQAIAQTSQQLNNFTNLSGKASEEAKKAMQEASNIQQKIQEYQTRSEPLKDLETQIEGGYEDAAKASIEELKKIAANSLDPISQKNAQNLLNQRAEQLAQAFGKNVEDVKKEMGTAVGELQGEQFATQEDFNKFMGIEAQKAAELQEEGLLNNQAEQPPAEQPVAEATAPVQPQAEQPAAPEETAPQTTEPAPVQPAPQAAAVPPKPVQPQPAPQAQAQAPQTQQIQQQTQAQTTGAPKLPAPQAAPTQPQTPAQPQAQAQATGMPKPPTPQPVQQQPFGGPLNNQLRQGFQRQLQQGFQNAMKIRSTAQPKPQQQAADPMEDRRRAVASQALGIASKPTSVSKPMDTGSAFDKGQNVNMNQQKSSVNKGVGRRPVR